MASEGDNEASDVAGAKPADDGGVPADEPAAPSSDSSSGRKTPLDDLSDAIVEARTLPRMEPPRRVSGPPPLPRRPAPPRPSRSSLPLPPGLPHARENGGASFSSSIPPQVLEVQPMGVDPVPEIRAPEWRHASAPPAEEPTLRLPVRGPHRWGVAAFAAIVGIGAGAFVAAAFDMPWRRPPAQTAVTMPNVARNPAAPGAHEPEVTPVADVRGVQPSVEEVTKQAKRDWAARAGQAPVAASALPPGAVPEAAAAAAAPAAAESPAAAPPTDAAPAAPEAAADPNMGFNRGAASAAIGAAADVAASCRQPEDRPGRAQVSLTFAPSGRVTQVIVSGDKYAGTPTGSCIARAFKGLSVPPFTGDAVTVTKAVRVR
jgi:hypothetical protein